MALRVLICGSRNWNKPWRILEQLTVLHNTKGVSCVVDGAAPGADTQGHNAAQRLRLPFQRFPAKWRIHKRGAGLIRNQQMIDEGKLDYAMAFHEDINNSKGTKDMLARLTKAGIPFDLYDS
jgi:hypothetical protein